MHHPSLGDCFSLRVFSALSSNSNKCVLFIHLDKSKHIHYHYVVRIILYIRFYLRDMHFICVWRWNFQLKLSFLTGKQPTRIGCHEAYRLIYAKWIWYHVHLFMVVVHLLHIMSTWSVLHRTWYIAQLLHSPHSTATDSIWDQCFKRCTNCNAFKLVVYAGKNFQIFFEYWNKILGLSISLIAMMCALKIKSECL